MSLYESQSGGRLSACHSVPQFRVASFQQLQASLTHILYLHKSSFTPLFRLMNVNHATAPHESSRIASKFVVTYSKLFQGVPPSQINPQQNRDRFFADLLDLKINRSYLQRELDKISKEICLGKLKVSGLHNCPVPLHPKLCQLILYFIN
jgi:hypothetical protein